MSMEHKAFLFKFRDFKRELLPILEETIPTGDFSRLREFINYDRQSFKDPYEGELLDDGWEELISIKEIQQYADFALTKYYDPSDDIGIGPYWEDIQLALIKEFGTSSALLGRTLKIVGIEFDPGKMGSYFQSEDDVRINLTQTEQKKCPTLDPLVRLLEKAVDFSVGLYITF